MELIQQKDTVQIHLDLHEKGKQNASDEIIDIHLSPSHNPKTLFPLEFIISLLLGILLIVGYIFQYSNDLILWRVIIIGLIGKFNNYPFFSNSTYIFIFQGLFTWILQINMFNSSVKIPYANFLCYSMRSRHAICTSLFFGLLICGIIFSFE